MAGKPKAISQIKQLIQLHQQGKSIKFIARSLGISKNTVKEGVKTPCYKIELYWQFVSHYLIMI